MRDLNLLQGGPRDDFERMRQLFELGPQNGEPLNILWALPWRTVQGLKSPAAKLKHKRTHFHLQVSPQLQQVSSVIEFCWENL